MPNEFTFGSVLKASAGIAAAEEGKQIHVHVFKAGLEREVFAGSALVDMYAKCQNMADARQVFDKMRRRDEVSWGAMICGYAQNGCSEEAVRIFYDIKGVGLTVNSFALSSVLRACSECKVSHLVRTSLTNLSYEDREDHGRQQTRAFCDYTASHGVLQDQRSAWA